MVDVATARRKLLEALGEYGEKYWTNMKLWYKQKISKDDFDTQAFELLGPGKISYHNEFLLSILAKCQTVAVNVPVTSQSKSVSKSSSNKSVHLRKPRVKRPSDSSSTQSQPFERCDSMKGVPPFITKGRLFLGAWDAGLDAISDETASLLVAAVETHLKNVLSACVARRKPYRIREGSHFQYRYGASHMKTLLHNEGIYKQRDPKQLLTCEQADAESFVRLAAGEVRNVVLPPISLFDLKDTIQENKSIIPSHTVREGNMERIFSDLWHPGHEEILQNELYILETRKLHERLKQQRALRI